MKTMILATLSLVSFGGSLSAADDKDKADRDRKARVALALAGTGKSATVATAPSPRVVVPKDYSAGHAKAIADEKPLVVFVGCNRSHLVNGAIVSRVDEFGDVRGPAVVVGYPVGDRVMIHATLQCPVTDADLDAAVKAASKKINDPPAKAMPAPKPLDWSVLTSDEEEIAANAEFVGLFRNRRGARGNCNSCANCPGCSNAPIAAPAPEAVEAKRLVSDPPAKLLPSASSFEFGQPTSNCPGGVCPAPSASTRSGGWYLGKNIRR